jgi:PhnB protein
MAKHAKRTNRAAGKARSRQAGTGKPRRTRTVKPIPDGYHVMTPYLTVRGADAAIQFYKKAFGAVERMRLAGADGRVMHAELKMLGTIVMLTDEVPDMGRLSPQALAGTPVGLLVYSRDVDAAVDRAVSAGATLKMPVQDMFWGDRFGGVEDPFGHNWQIATHKEDLTPREIRRRWQAQLAAGGGA